jgi:hypothetical protein
MLLLQEYIYIYEIVLQRHKDTFFFSMHMSHAAGTVVSCSCGLKHCHWSVNIWFGTWMIHT